ncbi:hypothetical protein ASD90_04445 [Terrabacter sp. Root181]|nr:hypothetical protein ASD90_04445 [Terrabacter sp. Root181]
MSINTSRLPDDRAMPLSRVPLTRGRIRWQQSDAPVTIEAQLIIRVCFSGKGVHVQSRSAVLADLTAWFDSLDVKRGQPVNHAQNVCTAQIWLSRQVDAANSPLTLLPPAVRLVRRVA